MVQQLEEQWDERAAGGSRRRLRLRPALPSGDELAAELERFLREQGD